MSPERQRVVIAELCGWTYQPTEEDWKWFDKEGEGYRYLPDYLNDLNAMHDAEKTLNSRQRSNYACLELEGMVWDAVHATAAQRAKAFLKTLNKWEDSQ